MLASLNYSPDETNSLNSSWTIFVFDSHPPVFFSDEKILIHLTSEQTYDVLAHTHTHLHTVTHPITPKHTHTHVHTHTHQHSLKHTHVRRLCSHLGVAEEILGLAAIVLFQL